MSRRLLIAGAVVVLGLGAAIGIYAYNESEDPVRKRGSAKQEFAPAETPKPKPEPKEPWPTYRFDNQRLGVSPYRHRPPYRELWTIDAHDLIEFPPAIAYGRAYLAQQRGRFYALESRTGKVAWRKKTGHCSASSPAVSDGVVYQAWMDKLECPQDRPGARGYLIAWDADSGRTIWRRDGAPIESSLLVVRKTLYFGDWSHRIRAVSAKTGRQRWSFQADDQVNSSAAYSNGTIYIASDAGTLYALNAKTGRLRWKTTGGASEFFYATPTVAYGRVYIGNTDGTMYVFGARTGKLRWARPLGSYVYSAAAAWKRHIFVGTYDGKLYSLDAATGDVEWKIDTPAAVHSGPTVMGGLVYYSICSSCGSQAQRSVKRGPENGSYAVDARNGRTRWRFRSGKYASPVVADTKRIYVTGRQHLTALEEKRKRKRSRRSR